MRRSELRAQRGRMRAKLRERLRDQREQLRNRPAVKAVRDARDQRRRKRRRRMLIASSLLLLLLLLLQCEVPRDTGGGDATPIAMVTPKEPVTFGARLETQKRPGYSVAARPGPDWLDEFRLQVAARSTRLATCFNGSERGGAIRWTTSIDAQTGAVTGHEFEPLGSTAMLSAEQKGCAVAALSDPGYRLNDPPAQALPNRVSLVLEF